MDGCRRHGGKGRIKKPDGARRAKKKRERCKLFSRDIGIDLGTANTLVYMKGKGIVMREPSVVAMDVKENMVMAVGSEAKEMIGRTPGSISAVRPLKDGVIADFDVTSDMLKYFIRTAVHSTVFSRPRVVICIPSGVTEVERRAVDEAARNAGAKAVELVEEPMAAAIGAGLQVNEAAGCMVVDIGGGTAEVAVISMGSIVASRSVRSAGDEFEKEIIAYVKRKYNVLIGDRTAEEIKIAIASAAPYEGEEPYSVMGRNLVDGFPKEVTLTPAEIREVLSEQIGVIIDAILTTLERTPPELSADILETGITLAGGGAMLHGMDKLVAQQTGMPVFIAEEPLDCVARGTGAILESPETFSRTLFFDNRPSR